MAEAERIPPEIVEAATRAMLDEDELGDYTADEAEVAGYTQQARVALAASWPFMERAVAQKHAEYLRSLTPSRMVYESAAQALASTQERERAR